ncbi:Allergen Asp f 4 [Colletotrichum chlorophyti]|uniref:Allergen Asp f 4 n=1 Tax=Colletotrichum chlorophyti TaxID=708187 RepID=A0A1Q8RCC8_9PEZI|nr:Allergen Asp f 4 [Colletotrichum chlorophyti]
MQLTSALVVLSAALTGVSAHPSLHGHQHFHERRTVDAVEERDLTFIKNKAPEPSPSSTSSAPAGTPTPSSGAKGEYVPFCNGKKTKRATIAEIAYSGNLGTEDSWGCNMQIVDDSIKDLYNYTATFTSSKDTYTCSCFNKIGPKGLIDGCWFAALTFSVKEGQEKTVAFDADSQGSCACGPGSEVPKTFIGQFAGTWLEFDWGSTPNGGNSGADASVLVAGATGLPYYGMKVDANGKTCSWVKSDGSNKDAYMPGMEAADGVGCKGYYDGHLDVVLGDNFST